MKLSRIQVWGLVAGLGVAAVLGAETVLNSAPPAAPTVTDDRTIKEIMDTMVDPNADILFGSVRQIADEHGISETAPQTDEDWEQVQRALAIRAKAPDLLTSDGRKVAKSTDRSLNPLVENEPQVTQGLIDADRSGFVKRARLLRDAVAEGKKAADAKDKEALKKALNSLDKACESCHLEYFYPNDKRAQDAARANGI